MHSFAQSPDGVRIGVQLTGNGPPLVLVSGLDGRSEYWTPLVAALGNSFRILTYDHRGAGQSSRADTRYTLQEMTVDLLAVLDQFCSGPVILMGHSTGGALAQRVAIEFPERVSRLVLSATWARACPYFRRLFECRLEILEGLGLDAYARQSELLLHSPLWLATHRFRSDALVPGRRDSTAEQILRRKIAAILLHDSLDELQRIRCPTLIVVAADDIVTPPHLSEQLARTIPGARLEIMPGGGHYALHERPDAYLRCVAPFLIMGQRRATPA